MVDKTATQTMHGLWDFSVSLYGKSDVKEACLELQDRFGLDVNLLLFAVWSAVAGPGRLDAERFRDCLRLTEAWQAEMIQPLRSLRRSCQVELPAAQGADTAALGDRLQAAELAAERLELDLLAGWAAEQMGRRADEEIGASAASNLVAYLAAAGVAPADAAEPMRRILAAAVPAVRPV
ncbi:MAG: TIGR02444 family protein [Gammaproteobacteria bacterium]